MEKTIDVWYIAPGPSTDDDPLAAKYQDNPVRTLVPAVLFLKTNKLVVKNTTIEDPVEGDSIGNWRRRDGVRRSVILNCFNQLKSLRNDPVVGQQVSIFLNILNPNTRESLLESSINTLADTNDTAVARRNALEVVKLLLIQELSD